MSFVLEDLNKSGFEIMWKCISIYFLSFFYVVFFVSGIGDMKYGFI